MKKLFKLMVFLCVVFLTIQASFAVESKILVLPDNIQFESTNYFIYPDSSVMFATDTINELKKSNKVQTVSMNEVRDALRKNQKLNLRVRSALKEFKYNYNVAFVDIKAIADCFSTDKVLIITSQTDAQNYALRQSIWDILNFPGQPVVNPAYKISTYAALVDVNKEEIMWEKTFHKILSTKDSRMLAQNFAPATEQLDKIKFYSKYFLSPEVSLMVQAKISPPALPAKKTDEVVEISNTKTNTEFIKDDLDLKPKALPFRPSSTKNSNTGMIINDL